MIKTELSAGIIIKYSYHGTDALVKIYKNKVNLSSDAKMINYGLFNSIRQTFKFVIPHFVME